jgi:hypothetical protein
MEVPGLYLFSFERAKARSGSRRSSLLTESAKEIQSRLPFGEGENILTHDF